jgi:hypothetical protein
MRQIIGERDTKVSTQWQAPPDRVPTAPQDSGEPVLPAAENGQAAGKLIVADNKKPRKSHGRRKKLSAHSRENDPAQLAKKESSDTTAAQADE